MATTLPLAAAFTIALGTTAFGTAPASGATMVLAAARQPVAGHSVAVSPAVSPAISAAERRAAVSQIRVDKAAVGIELLGRSTAGAGFAGIVASGQQRSVTVYWHGAVPRTASVLLHKVRAGGVTVRLRPAPYTEAQLNARARDVITRRGFYQRAGLIVTGVFVRTDGSGVDVDASATEFKAPKALPAVAGDAMSNIPARVIITPSATPLDRLSDYVPHWAGARIESNSASCTSGFPIVSNSDGRTFILTAGHCTGTPWYAAVSPNSTHDYKFGDTWKVTNGLDIQYIRSFVQGRTYDGGVKPGTESNKPVVGTSGNQPGDSVCQSGAWTGIHCGMTILQHGYRLIDGSWVPGWAACQQSGLLCSGTDAGVGDSGAPVFSLAANPSQVLARGSLSLGLGFSFNCSNNNRETTPCYHEIFFVDIQDILNNFGARILTSS